MLAQWICDLVGQMHKFKVPKKKLAEHLGVTPEYVSMVLNGHRNPVGAQARFESAVLELIAEAQSCSDDSTEDVP